MFASKATHGFYDTAIHDSMPDDVVEISAENHADLLAGQSEGKVIVWDDDGFPVLVDPPPPSDEELAVIERLWRNQRLSETDNVVTRHRDEKELNLALTLTPEQFAELLVYRQALRDWPQAASFPAIEFRPVAPSWITEQVQ